MYYKNLYRYTRCFVAGNVVLRDTDECAEGAKVTVSKGNEKVFDEVVTNNYGDFKIDKLKENSGDYQLEIVYPGYKRVELSVDLKTSVNLGTLFL